MNIVQFLVEIYLGNELIARDTNILPDIFAIQQCSQMCLSYAQEKQPYKIIFINDRGETLIYKNPSFVKFEED